ncbi:MAG: hypothetical protein RL653_4545, partial [Pseudomonadota bacterium]
MRDGLEPEPASLRERVDEALAVRGKVVGERRQQ